MNKLVMFRQSSARWRQQANTRPPSCRMHSQKEVLVKKCEHRRRSLATRAFRPAN